MDTRRSPLVSLPVDLNVRRALQSRLRWIPIGAFALLAGCDPPTQGDSLNVPPAPSGSASATPPVGGNSRFDAVAFEQVIQPILDTAESKGCTAATCHGAPSGQSGFALKRSPASGSADMAANFAAVTARCDLSIPDQSLFYKHATTRHASGNSAVVSQQQVISILSWIQHAQPPAIIPPVSSDPDAGIGGGTSGGTGGTSDASAPPATGGNANCITADKFNLGLFTSEILPMLLGQIDYNAQPGQAISYDGCGRSSCHGGTAAGKLHISETSTPVQNLQSFGCYINSAAPSQSPILACPLNTPGCPKSPHPGQNVFRDTTDRNYQRILSFLYATQGVANPFDFAFFARQIDPIFKDPNVGGLGLTGGRTCANTSSCHGVNVAGQIPPNLSNFPMLASSISKSQIQIDYWSAANFTNFTTPQGSELFLFPTDLTSDVTQPFATGLHHPGGLDFDSNSVQAQAIQQWAGGLRPDNNGNVLDWLVAGTYSATQINQRTTAGDETRLAPQIFDNDGAFQFNGGQWDALVSPSANVDLNVVFPGNAGTGRVAYAVAYLMNTTSSDLQNVLIQVSSPNTVLVYADGRPIAQTLGNGSSAIGIATLPAFSPAKASTEILLKVLQGPNDNQFGFSVSLQNQQGNVPLSNTSGEVILRLDPSGGI